MSDEHSEYAIHLLSLSVVVFLAFLLQNLTKVKFLKWLPACATSVFFGMILGGIVHLLDAQETLQILFFDPSVFYIYLLPLIVFEGAYNARKRYFLKNLVSITLFATLGTVLATVATFSLLAIFNPSNVHVGGVELMKFSTVISAIDPVATLSIFNALKVHPTLHYLCFGESIMNDAVVIVLYKQLAALDATSSISWMLGGELLMGFVSIFTLSIFFGVVCGLAVSLFFKAYRAEDFSQTVMFLMGILFTYGATEILGLSGVLSLLACGLVMGHFAKYNIAPKQEALVHDLLLAISHCSEMFVFVLLGTSFFLPPHTGTSFLDAVDLWYFTLVILVCVVSRFIVVFLLGACTNIFRKKPFDFKTLFMLAFNGLRGAVCFSLVLGLDNPLFTSSTLVLTFFTILCLASWNPLLIKTLKVPTHVPEGPRLTKSKSSLDAFLKRIFMTDEDAKQRNIDFHDKLDEKEEESVDLLLMHGV